MSLFGRLKEYLKKRKEQRKGSNGPRLNHADRTAEGKKGAKEETEKSAALNKEYAALEAELKAQADEAEGHVKNIIQSKNALDGFEEELRKNGLVKEKGLAVTKILRYAVFLLAVTSFFTTAYGFDNSLLEGNSMLAYTLSFAFQSVLLALNFVLPRVFMDKPKQGYKKGIGIFVFAAILVVAGVVLCCLWQFGTIELRTACIIAGVILVFEFVMVAASGWNVKKFGIEHVTVLLFAFCLCLSSGFSFVFYANQAYKDSTEADTETVLVSSFNQYSTEMLQRVESALSEVRTTARESIYSLAKQETEAVYLDDLQFGEIEDLTGENWDDYWNIQKKIYSGEVDRDTLRKVVIGSPIKSQDNGAYNLADDDDGNDTTPVTRSGEETTEIIFPLYLQNNAASSLTETYNYSDLDTLYTWDDMASGLSVWYTEGATDDTVNYDVLQGKNELPQNIDRETYNNRYRAGFNRLVDIKIEMLSADTMLTAIQFATMYSPDSISENQLNTVIEYVEKQKASIEKLADEDEYNTGDTESSNYTTNSLAYFLAIQESYQAQVDDFYGNNERGLNNYQNRVNEKDVQVYGMIIQKVSEHYNTLIYTLNQYLKILEGIKDSATYQEALLLNQINNIEDYNVDDVNQEYLTLQVALLEGANSDANTVDLTVARPLIVELGSAITKMNHLVTARNYIQDSLESPVIYTVYNSDNENISAELADTDEVDHVLSDEIENLQAAADLVRDAELTDSRTDKANFLNQAYASVQAVLTDFESHEVFSDEAESGSSWSEEVINQLTDINAVLLDAAIEDPVEESEEVITYAGVLNSLNTLASDAQDIDIKTASASAAEDRAEDEMTAEEANGTAWATEEARTTEKNRRISQYQPGIGESYQTIVNETAGSLLSAADSVQTAELADTADERISALQTAYTLLRDEKINQNLNDVLNEISASTQSTWSQKLNKQMSNINALMVMAKQEKEAPEETEAVLDSEEKTERDLINDINNLIKDLQSADAGEDADEVIAGAVENLEDAATHIRTSETAQRSSDSIDALTEAYNCLQEVLEDLDEYSKLAEQADKAAESAEESSEPTESAPGTEEVTQTWYSQVIDQLETDNSILLTKIGTASESSVLIEINSLIDTLQKQAVAYEQTQEKNAGENSVASQANSFNAAWSTAINNLLKAMNELTLADSAVITSATDDELVSAYSNLSKAQTELAQAENAGDAATIQESVGAALAAMQNIADDYDNIKIAYEEKFSSDDNENWIDFKTSADSILGRISELNASVAPETFDISAASTEADAMVAELSGLCTKLAKDAVASKTAVFDVINQVNGEVAVSGTDYSSDNLKECAGELKNLVYDDIYRQAIQEAISANSDMDWEEFSSELLTCVNYINELSTMEPDNDDYAKKADDAGDILENLMRVLNGETVTTTTMVNTVSTGIVAAEPETAEAESAAAETAAVESAEGQETTENSNDSGMISDDVETDNSEMLDNLLTAKHNYFAKINTIQKAFTYFSNKWNKYPLLNWLSLAIAFAVDLFGLFLGFLIVVIKPKDNDTLPPVDPKGGNGETSGTATGATPPPEDPNGSGGGSSGAATGVTPPPGGPDGPGGGSAAAALAAGPQADSADRTGETGKAVQKPVKPGTASGKSENKPVKTK